MESAKCVGLYVQNFNERGTTSAVMSYYLMCLELGKNVVLITASITDQGLRRARLAGIHPEVVANGTELKILLERRKVDIVYYIGCGDLYVDFPSELRLIAHIVFPHTLNDVYQKANKAIYLTVSNWLSNTYFSGAFQTLPHVVDLPSTDRNLRSELAIPSQALVIGFYGGSTSFDMPVIWRVIEDILKVRSDVFFLFANINRFLTHERAIFLPTLYSREEKEKFVNTADAMLYGRSLGESFGIACGEFAVSGKPIIAYSSPSHCAHLEMASEGIIKFNSEKELREILSCISQKEIRSLSGYETLYKLCDYYSVLDRFDEVLSNSSSQYSDPSYLKNYLELKKGAIRSRVSYWRFGSVK